MSDSTIWRSSWSPAHSPVRNAARSRCITRQRSMKELRDLLPPLRVHEDLARFERRTWADPTPERIVLLAGLREKRRRSSAFAWLDVRVRETLATEYWLANRSSFEEETGPPSRLRYGGQPSPAFMSEGWCGRGTRTPTVLLPPAPQAGASANSATSARREHRVWCRISSVSDSLRLDNSRVALLLAIAHPASDVLRWRLELCSMLHSARTITMLHSRRSGRSLLCSP